MIVRQLLRDETGAALTELALVAVLLSTMAAGVIDLSTAYSRKLGLEQAAQRAIEKIMQTTGEETVETTLKTEAVCQVNGTNDDGTCRSTPISASNVTVTFRLICRNNAGEEQSNVTKTNAGEFDALACSSSSFKENRFIEVSIRDTFTGIFVHKFVSGDGKSMAINAAAGMRTQ